MNTNTIRAVGITVGGIILAAAVIFILYPLIRGNTKEQFESIKQSEISTPKPREVRGQPYNEILVVYRYFNQITAGVYNDIGENHISEQEFADINTDAITM